MDELYTHQAYPMFHLIQTQLRAITVSVLTVASLFVASQSMAAFTLTLDGSDFGISSNFNNVTEFLFEIEIDGALAQGTTYDDPAINQIDYRVRGALAQQTPSGFSGFLLIRSVTGAEFYNLSDDATLQFTVSAGADLSDGLQLAELDILSGTEILRLNLREFNQAPGRYHPPLLTLNSDGTGQLLNADNQSTFPNPPPPMGSGLLVDVTFGEEYDVALSFDPLLTIADAVAVPAPLGTALLFISLGLVSLSTRFRANNS